MTGVLSFTACGDNGTSTESSADKKPGSSSATTGATSSAPTTDTKKDDTKKGAWGYTGETGPANWGKIAGNETCGTGKEQSPIDLTKAKETEADALTFKYAAAPLKLENNKHTVVASFPEGNTLSIGDAKYALKQFHYHTKSEHSIDGELMPAEFHLVHANEAGNLAVVGVMFKEGKENKALAGFIKNMPAAGKKVELKETINAADILPADKTTFRYDGSLTTPPCTEKVKWHVMKTPLEASPEQLKALYDLFKANNRPVQPLNDRGLAIVKGA